MLRLIERALPAPVHRAGLRLAHRLRHRWRSWRQAPLTACAAVICDLAGNILLVRHHYGPDVWALPGGGVDRGEDPCEAIARELAEEIALRGLTFEKVAVLEETISSSPLACHLFFARCDMEPVPDGREIAEARFFPPHSLPEPQGARTRARLDAWRAWRRQSAG